MAVPAGVKYAVIGAGIHGLSTAYHLAGELKAKGRGSGSDILVIDKTAIAAGASGIACGVVRNNYFQPAMRELMAHSVEVWESDPKAYSYHPVGYMQISPEVMHEGCASIYRQQQSIGYPSEFVEGEKDSMRYMKGLFDDWQAKGITSVLHEKKGGYANNTASIYGLAAKAEGEGVRIMTGVEVTGFEFGNNSRAVTALLTDKGRIACDYVVVGVGPWINKIWNLLELPRTVSIKGRDGKMHDGVRMWKYWCLEEGTLGVDPNMHKTNDGRMPPVIHVDTDAPLYSDVDGSLITDKLWGLYYKPDFNFGGVQGGSSPYVVSQVPMVPIVPISSSAITSFTAGVLCSPIARSALKARSQSIKKTRNPAASAASRQTVSLSSTSSATTCSSSPTPTTAIRCWASANWSRRRSPAENLRSSNRSVSRATPKAGCIPCRKVPSRGVEAMSKLVPD
jgi:hypothetical protein